MKTAGALGALCTVVLALFASDARQAVLVGRATNPIQAENARAATPGWRYPDAHGAINGYASEMSVGSNKLLHLHVSTNPPEPYQVRIYRLGWYHGGGARLVTCTPSCTKFKPGSRRQTPQPDPATGEVRANWPVTDVVRAGSTWVSGYYIAQLLLQKGPGKGRAATVPFIVRAPSSRKTPILVQASVNTWQAYNNWGGKSLYGYNSSDGVPATHVSFDRPHGWSAQTPFAWEYQTVRFLEREGEDVSYTTDIDTDANPASLLRHRLVIVAGHDEYWTHAMRQAFERARDSGVNLMFLGGNIGYWQARYADNRRTLIEYRDANADPISDQTLKTVRFRELTPPIPECSLLGVEGQGGIAREGDPARDYSVVPASLSDPWFAGTGFDATSTIRGVVGYEWDSIMPDCSVPGTLTTFFHYQGRQGDHVPFRRLANADAVRYVAPSGATVFSAGSLQLTWALDDYGHPGYADDRVQRFMTNALTLLTR